MEQVAALKEGQCSMRGRIEALDSRLAGVESDLAIIKDRLLGQFHIDPHYVAERLGLTPGQSRVAVALAEGSTVRNIAKTTGRTENTIRQFVKKIHGRLNISTRTELVRLVLLLPYGTVMRGGKDAKVPEAHGQDHGPHRA